MGKGIDTKEWKLNKRKGGKALKDHRIQRGLTQDELSALTDVPKTLISRLEQYGTLKPSVEMCVRLWAALGFDPNRMAQDFGMYKPTVRPHDDPRRDEVTAMVSTLTDEQRKELYDMWYFTAKVYIEQHTAQLV